jgi:iron(III) transport system permease protein
MAVTSLPLALRESALRIRSAPWVWVSVVVLAVLAVLSLAPVLFILVNSFNESRPGEAAQFSLQGWRDAFSDPTTLDSIRYTFILLVRHPIGLALGFLVAWTLIRVRVPFAGFIELSFWLAYFLPHLPMAVSWIFLLDPNYGLINQFLLKPVGLSLNIYSLFGITWAHITTSTIPIMLILLAPMIKQTDAALEEAARVSGASAWYTFRRILVPILAPGLLAVFIVSIIRGLEAIQIELLLGIPAKIYVYATRIYDLVRWEPAQWPPAMALSTLFLGILFVLAMFYSRFTAHRQFATLTGKTSFRQMDIGPWRWVIAAALLLYVAITVYLPLAVLALGSFMRVFGFFNVANPFSTVHWARVLSNLDFEAAVRTSLTLGVGVALLGIILYGLLAYLLVKTPMPGKTAASVLVWLPWGIPGLLIGLAFLWLFLSTPLLWPIYGTVFSLIIVLLVQEMPIGVHLARSAFIQVGNELEEAARISGASWFQTYRRIMLPLVTPMLVSIFIIVFMAAVRAIDSVILLGSSTTRPLSLLMMEYSLAGNMESAAIVGIVISAIALVLGVVSRRFGSRLSGR